VVNQLQKVLEWANIKLANVVSDIMGVSARTMLAAIVDGETNPAVLAGLGDKRLRATPIALAQALEGHVRPHHRFILAQHLIHIDFLEEQIASFDQQIADYLVAHGAVPPADPPAPDATAAATPVDVPDTGSAAMAWQDARELLDTAPGIGPAVAEIVIAEVGTDMGRFPSAAHLASWAKVAPGNRESGGKCLSGRTGQGSRWLRTALVQAANAAIRVKDTHLRRVYQRLVVRRGHKKALMAVAHRLLVAIYYMLKDRVPYREMGAAAPSETAKRKLADRMQRRLEKLGYTVRLEPAPQPAPQAA
jgi:transposase